MDNPWADATDPHQEADLATPSWSAVRWAEPSDSALLWSNTAAVPSWTPPKSPYKQEEARQPGSPVSERLDSTDFQTAPTTPASPEADSLPPASPPPHPPPEHPAGETTPTRPNSPDGFGTFETADAWTSSEPTLKTSSSLDNNDSAWGATWAPEDQPRVDEWELAKLQKQKQDQHVVSPQSVVQTCY